MGRAVSGRECGRILAIRGNRGRHTLDGFGHNFGGSREIEAHVSLAAFAEGHTGAEANATEFQDFGGIVTETEIAAIDQAR